MKTIFLLAFCFSIAMGQEWITGKPYLLKQHNILSHHPHKFYIDDGASHGWREVDTFYIKITDVAGEPLPFTGFIPCVKRPHDRFGAILDEAAKKTDEELFGMSLNTPVTRQDFFRYAEECYNDSVFSFVAIYGKPYKAREYDPKWEQDIIGQKKVWHHHNKPTFQGFIEWLKGK